MGIKQESDQPTHGDISPEAHLLDVLKKHLSPLGNNGSKGDKSWKVQLLRLNTLRQDGTSLASLFPDDVADRQLGKLTKLTNALLRMGITNAEQLAQTPEQSLSERQESGKHVFDVNQIEIVKALRDYAIALTSQT